jgi:hypothetical protein
MRVMSVPAQIGRYRIESRLGAGGFAVVWLAHDESLDTKIAIKVLADNWAGEPELRARFLAEARMLRRASSARVVQVFDIGELDDGRPYFVMEYAERGTLSDRLRREGAFPLAEALRLTAEVARGVADLHRAGILHRDLKPSNVLIARAADGQDRLLVADLGVAKNLAHGSNVTMSVGSVGYMAPEQAVPSKGADVRADVYSLGALAANLITGKSPGMAGYTVPLLNSYPEMPEPVRELLAQALAPQPEHRWPDAASFSVRLKELAQQYSPSVPQAGPPDRAAVPAETASSAATRHVVSAPTPAPASALAPVPGDQPAAWNAAPSPPAAPAPGAQPAWGARPAVPAAKAQPAAGWAGAYRSTRGVRRRSMLLLSAGCTVVVMAAAGFVILHQLNSGSSVGDTHLAAYSPSPSPSVTESVDAAATEAAPGTAGKATPKATETTKKPVVTNGSLKPDGKWNYVILTEVQNSSGGSEGQLKFDLVDYYTGQAATQACRQDGVAVTDVEWCNDFYWRNNSHLLRTVKVATDADLKYYTDTGVEKTLSPAQLDKLSELGLVGKEGDGATLFKMTEHSGVVDQLREIFGD